MFFTLEDPRAKIQGSRDPLGVQPVWSGFGRHLVTNLTTVSDSVRGFAVLLLGRYFAERLIGDGTAGEHEALPIFVRTEQVCAYARHVVNSAKDILGIEKVKRFLDGGGTVHIEDGPRGWILTDQKSYGVWGLFTVPARNSGLVESGPVGLTVHAREFVESEYLPHLNPVFDALCRLIRENSSTKATNADPVMQALAAALPNKLSANERAFYGRYLRDAKAASGKNGGGLQPALACLLAKRTDLAKAVSRHDIVALAKASNATCPELERRLRRVARLEALLVPAALIFDFALTRHGQTPGSVATELRAQWEPGVPNLTSTIGELLREITEHTSSDLAGHASTVDQALREAAYGDAVLGVLQWNRTVMARRNAAPWVAVVDGRLDVRYRGTESRLPNSDQLAQAWHNSYFLTSLKRITEQTTEAD